MLTCFELTFLGLGMILGLLRSCEALVNEGSLRSVHPYPGFHSLDGLSTYMKGVYGAVHPYPGFHFEKC